MWSGRRAENAMILLQRVALFLLALAFLLPVLLPRDANGDELAEELARTIESLHPFGVQGLPRAYEQSAQPDERRQAIALGLAWLTAHQAPDGSWQPHELFWCRGKKHPEGPEGKGKSIYAIGITGMSVAAYLGAGYTTRGDHPHAQAVRRALSWLLAQQDADGCVGERRFQQYIYNHAFATLAFVQAYALTGETRLAGPAQKALDFIALARNPYFAWRYGVKPGDNDTSLTGCVGFPLYAALRLNQASELAGLMEPLDIDSGAFQGIRRWIDRITDKDYGRAGYVTRGTGPARPQEMVKQFPGEKSEACTAITVLLRLLLPAGQETREQEKHNQDMIDKGVALMLGLKPHWSTKAGTLDLYYWYYATMAMARVGGKAWTSWDKALAEAVLSEQCKDGDVCGTFGSWDPDSVWAQSDGGRIYATAMGLLMLETPDRMRSLPADRSDLIDALEVDALPADRLASILRGLGYLRVPRGAAAAAPWLKHETPHVRAACADALGRLEIGSQELQALVGSTQDPERTVRLAAVRSLARQGAKTKTVVSALSSCLHDKDAEIAAAAARALGATGDASLAEVLRTCMQAGALELRVAAAAAVYQLSGETMSALPILIEGMSAPSARIRVDAARTMEEIKPIDPKSGRVLQQALTDKSFDVRIHAAGALFATNQSKEDCIDAWISVLDAPSTRSRLRVMERLEANPSPRAAEKLGRQLLSGSKLLRVRAATTLGAIGTGARSEAAALAWCARNGPTALREAAQKALSALQLDVASARTHLIPVFTSKDEKKQDRRLLEGAVHALVLVGEPIVPALVAELRLGSTAVKKWTLYIFRALGPKAGAAARDIAAVMNAGDIKIKLAAATTLARIGPQAEEALSDLEALLGHKDISLALVAVGAIAGIAPGSDDALQVLKTVAQDKREKAKPLRYAAVAGMGGLGKRGELMIPLLFELVEESDKLLQRSAIAALARLWPMSEHRVADALAEGRPRVRRAAALVIAQVGPEARKMIKPLLKALDAGSYGGDESYGNALAAIGKASVSSLMRRLKHKQAQVRREAARTLGLIGPDAKKALKRLKKLLSDRDPGVVHHARIAIQKIQDG